MNIYIPPPRRPSPGMTAAQYVVGVAAMAAMLTALLALAPLLAALVQP